MVSTRVGGIPEVLPPELIYLVEPTVDALLEGLGRAIHDYKSGNTICPFEVHRKIVSFYNWFDVTRRTEIVYDAVQRETQKTLGHQLASYLSSGVLPYLLVVSLCYIVLQFLEIFVPRKVSTFSSFFGRNRKISNFSLYHEIEKTCTES